MALLCIQLGCVVVFGPYFSCLVCDPLEKKEKKYQGTCEGTGWATRLKRGKEREDLREVYEGTEWATRLRKSGKKKM